MFFPLGLTLAWSGVLHWLLHATDLLPDYRPIFHSIVQIQGFLMCFAVGFLFTAIPRRTGTPPPAAWQMIAGLILPAATTVAAWFQFWALTQLFWLCLVAILIQFFIQRALSKDAARRPPVAFVWIPISLVMGVAGSFLTSAPGVLGPEAFWLHDLGRLLLLQGLFCGLIVGVGTMIIPLITCGDAPPDAGTGSGNRLALLGHLVAAALLATSFWIEISISLRGGLFLRSVVLLITLVAAARIYRLPRLPGGHRWLVWLSAWMIPAGYLLAALLPSAKKAGMHVVFIGGFSLMALSVGVHVTLAHGGYRRLLHGRPWQVPLYGGLILLAAAFRALVDLDQARFFAWLGVSAAVFLAGTIVWASFLLPRLRSPEN